MTTNQSVPVILSDKQIAEIEARVAKVPEGPWFAASDRAKECGPHRDSGLALVDTGRESDWPIARLCEWHKATFIAHSITDIHALCQTVRAMRAERLEIQRLLASTALEDPTEDDEPPYSTAELVQGVRFLLHAKDAARQRTAALREQLAEAGQELRSAFDEARSLERERNEALDQCTELHRRLAQHRQQCIPALDELSVLSVQLNAPDESEFVDVVKLARTKLAQVEQEREQCLHVQKRGARSLILCPCVAALESLTLGEGVENE